MSNSFHSFLLRIYQTTPIQSQSALAKFLGINRSAITQAKKRSSIPRAWLLELSKKFDLDPDWLATGKTHKGWTAKGRFCQVPKVRARLSAGGGSFETEGGIKEHYAFRWDWIRSKGRPEDMVLMDIVGDSMSPLLQAGDTLLIDQSQQEIISGQIYALGVEDTVMVKRVEKQPTRLALLSINSSYSPIYLQGDELENLRIIGRVIWFCREL